MRAWVLGYHDFDGGPGSGPSGFSGAGADRYRVDRGRFREQLDRVAAVTGSAPETAARLRSGDAPDGSWAITFDDGGASAVAASEELAGRGWRGHFFIPTDWLGRRAFVDVGALRALRAAGHVIGSHSSSHPDRMDRMRWAPLVAEWRRSVEVLSDALGEQVETGSVPGGYYGERVRRTAAAVGIRVLFTSRPDPRVEVIDECAVVGRFAVRRHVDASTVAALASGRPVPVLRERAAWTARTTARSAAPGLYLRARSALLSAPGRSGGGTRAAR